MSAGLDDLLFTIRQHPAFQELLKIIDAPDIKAYVPSRAAEAEAQTADWIFRSGRRAQQARWLEFLTDYVPPDGGSKPSDKEKS